MVLAFMLACVPVVDGGAFRIDINIGQDERAVNHPILYLGTGGVRTIRDCLDPEIEDVDVGEPAVERALETWSGMLPTSGNITMDVPEGLVDFESALLHELGHCLFGLAHPNLGLGEDLVAGQASNASPGVNGSFDIGLGSDEAPGSVDDARGDDINRVWFYTFDNYPFFLTTPIDETSYSRDIDDLPPGSSFAANANRLSGLVAQPQVAETEAVMNAYVLRTEARRSLQHDDVATFLYAASGLDQKAETADDYTVDIVYQGRTVNGCDVVIEDLPPDAPPAAAGLCESGAILIGGSTQHFRLAGVSRVQMGGAEVGWFYGAEVFEDGFESGDTGSWSEVVPQDSSPEP